MTQIAPGNSVGTSLPSAAPSLALVKETHLPPPMTQSGADVARNIRECAGCKPRHAALTRQRPAQ